MTFFGLSVDNSQEDWNSRRLRYLLKKYGSIKPGKLVSPLGTEPVSNYLEGIPNRRRTLGRQLSLMTQLSTPAPLSPCVVTRRNNALKALSTGVRLSVARRQRRMYTSPLQNGVLHLPAGSLYSPAPQTALIDGSPFAAENWVGLIETPGRSLPQLSVIPSPKSTVPDVEDGRPQRSSHVTTACINVSLLQRRHGRTKSPLHEKIKEPSTHLQKYDSHENSNVVSEMPAQRINYLSEENVISDIRPAALPRRPRYFFPSSTTTTMSSCHSRCTQGHCLDDLEADFEMNSLSPPVHRASLLVGTEPAVGTVIPLEPKAVPACEVSDLPPLSRLDCLRPPPLTIPTQSAPFAPGILQTRVFVYSTPTPSPSTRFTGAFSPHLVAYSNMQRVWAFEHGHLSPTLQALNIEAYSPGFAAFMQKCRDKARGFGPAMDENVNNRKQGRSSSEECPLSTAGPASLPETPFFYRRVKRRKDSSSSVTTSPQATPFLPPRPSPGRASPSRPWRLNNNLADKNASNSATATTNQRAEATSRLLTLREKLQAVKMTCFPARNRASQKIYQSVDQSLLDYRPYFTYFVSFVQVVILVLACAGYGFAPVGLNMEHEVISEVLLSSLAFEHVCRIEDENLWIGPRQADLIRIGARYSPCMRADATLYYRFTEAQKKWDRMSGCCVRNDGEGCHQTSRMKCPRATSMWLRRVPPDLDADELMLDQSTNKNDDKKLKIQSSLNHPLSEIGPVCGLDPEFCEEPRSTGPFAWSRTDVTEWPVRESIFVSAR